MTPTIYTPAELSPAEVAVARALVDRCNAADGLDLPISLEPGPAGDLALCFVGGQLVGLAQAQGFAETEICLCVDPRQRRRGHGRALLAAATAIAISQPTNGIALVADTAFAAAPAFAAAVGAQLIFAEHRLHLDPALVPPPPPPMPGLQIRRATSDDVAALALPIAAAFGDPAALVKHFIAQRIGQPGQRFLLAELDGEPVGALRLSPDGAWVSINAFAVLPSRQGRGIGRQMLLQTIEWLLAEDASRLRIEVESDNRRAHHLYAACGFVADATFQYYRLVVEGGQ